MKGALLASDLNAGPSPQTVEAELARYQALAGGAIIDDCNFYLQRSLCASLILGLSLSLSLSLSLALSLTAGLNRSMLFWEKDTTSQPRQDEGAARGEPPFDITKIGPTGPFGGAAYLQAHLPGTQQEHDEVSQAWAKRSSVVVEELSCFAPVRSMNAPSLALHRRARCSF